MFGVGRRGFDFDPDSDPESESDSGSDFLSPRSRAERDCASMTKSAQGNCLRSETRNPIPVLIPILGESTEGMESTEVWGKGCVGF